MAITVRFIGALRSASGKGKIAIKMKDAVPLREFIKKIIK